MTIGVTYEVTPVEGEPWTFRSTLGHEMAWERYATKHGLPLNPISKGKSAEVDMESFPMAANGAVLAWFDEKRRTPDLVLDDFAATLVSVFPVDEEEPDLPDPTRPAPGTASLPS